MSKIDIAPSNDFLKSMYADILRETGKYSEVEIDAAFIGDPNTVITNIMDMLE